MQTKTLLTTSNRYHSRQLGPSRTVDRHKFIQQHQMRCRNIRTFKCQTTTWGISVPKQNRNLAAAHNEIKGKALGRAGPMF